MKLNATLLFHEMQLYFQVDYMEISAGCFVKTPMFYNVFFDMDEHIVLVNGEQLGECLSRVQSAIVICLDRVESIPPVGENDLIILNDPMSSKMAFNILNHILEKFQEWETAMNDVLYKKRSFQDMIDLTGEMAGLPVALLDSHFRYIAYSKGSEIYLEQYVTPDNSLTPEVIASLQKSEGFMEQSREAYVTSVIEPLVCRNLFYEGAYVGRLAVILRNEMEDREYYKALFDRAAPFLEELYAQYNSFENVNQQYRDAHRLLTLILARRPADRRAFQELMKSFGALKEDRWRFFMLSPGAQSSPGYSRSFICSELERRMPGSYAVALDDRAAVLFNESLYGRKQGTDSLKELADILGMLRFEAGISRAFFMTSGFENICFACRQAEYAVHKSEGRAFGSMCFFDGCALDFLVENGGREAIFEQSCHPALIELRAYDKRHGTSFIRTLFTYLACNMNAVKAAEALFIHRSSFINRMQRIHQLVSLKLEEPDERLYLNLSFQIFKGELL